MQCLAHATSAPSPACKTCVHGYFAHYDPSVSHAFALVLQGLLALHRQRRAHCDVKPDNIRVQLAANGTLANCTLVDLGGSVDYSGELVESGNNRRHGLQDLHSSKHAF
jgi:serine/threonine protein kinase